MVQNWFENRPKPETDPVIWHGPAVGGSHLWRTFWVFAARKTQGTADAHLG